MRNGCSISRGRFGRADIHAAVHGHRVHGNDFRIQLLGPSDPEPGFARAGGAGENRRVLEWTRKHFDILNEIRMGIPKEPPSTKDTKVHEEKKAIFLRVPSCPSWILSNFRIRISNSALVLSSTMETELRAA